MVFESGPVISRHPANQNTVSLWRCHPKDRDARGIKNVISEPALEMEMWPGSVACAAYFSNIYTGVYPLTDCHIDLFHVGVDGIELLVLISKIMPNSDGYS